MAKSPGHCVQAIADKGGMMGIIFTPIYLWGTLADFDGLVPLPEGMRDVREVPKLLQALLAAGLREAQVEKVAGENLPRFLRKITAPGRCPNRPGSV